MKLAFVTPWYGPDIPGGAEALTRRTAEHLHIAGMDVEVLTTCIKDFYGDWGQNYHKPGTDQVNGVTVRRFPVEKRDQQAFNQINWRLLNNLSVSREQEQTFIEEMIRTPALYEYIAQHAYDYLFIFIPYMFATTYFGTQICPHRSIVIPCLHDENYARLTIYRQALSSVRGLVFLSESEEPLADLFWGPVNSQDPPQIRQVLGGGVDTDFAGDGNRFREKYGLNSPFVLYAGRREPGKNTPLLIGHWQRYLKEQERDVKLVLIGSGKVHIPMAVKGQILDLGFVSAQDKYDAYAAADVFCMPSVHESFSIVIMESWLAGTPVLVHGDCAVTKNHCQQSNGGLYFQNYAEFAATLNYLLTHRETAALMGQQGRRYVLNNFHWDMIINKYQNLFREALRS